MARAGRSGSLSQGPYSPMRTANGHSGEERAGLVEGARELGVDVDPDPVDEAAAGPVVGGWLSDVREPKLAEPTSSPPRLGGSRSGNGSGMPSRPAPYTGSF